METELMAELEKPEFAEVRERIETSIKGNLALIEQVKPEDKAELEAFITKQYEHALEIIKDRKEELAHTTNRAKS